MGTAASTAAPAAGVPSSTGKVTLIRPPPHPPPRSGAGFAGSYRYRHGDGDDDDEHSGHQRTQVGLHVSVLQQAQPGTGEGRAPAGIDDGGIDPPSVDGECDP